MTDRLIRAARASLPLVLSVTVHLLALASTLALLVWACTSGGAR